MGLSRVPTAVGPLSCTHGACKPGRPALDEWHTLRPQQTAHQEPGRAPCGMRAPSVSTPGNVGFPNTLCFQRQNTRASSSAGTAKPPGTRASSPRPSPELTAPAWGLAPRPANGHVLPHRPFTRKDHVQRAPRGHL